MAYNPDFDEIRPYNEDEMPAVFNELLEDRQFNLIMKGFAPWLPKALRNGILRMMFRGVKTAQDFQIRFMKPIVWYIAWWRTQCPVRIRRATGASTIRATA